MLDKDLKADCEQFQVLCERCHKLAHEYKNLQNRLIEIKNEIIIQHKGVHKTEIEDDHDYKETKEIVQNSEEANKENEIPKKILFLPSSDDDSTQVKIFVLLMLLWNVYIAEFYTKIILINIVCGN